MTYFVHIIGKCEISGHYNIFDKNVKQKSLLTYCNRKKKKQNKMKTNSIFIETEFFVNYDHVSF